MSAPTATIFAFRPPAVNGDVCRIGLNLAPGGVVNLEAPTSLLRALATALLATTGGSESISKRDDALIEKITTRADSRTEEGRSRIALYEQVAAIVRNDQVSWIEAGERVGVNGEAAYQFFYVRRKNAAKKLGAAVNTNGGQS